MIVFDVTLQVIIFSYFGTFAASRHKVNRAVEYQKLKISHTNAPEMKRSRGVRSPGAQEGYPTPSSREDIGFFLF